MACQSTKSDQNREPSHPEYYTATYCYHVLTYLWANPIYQFLKPPEVVVDNVSGCMCQRTSVTLIAPVWLDDKKSSSNQRGANGVKGCGWHMRILLRFPTALIVWDFDFLRGLAPGSLDGFSIGRYEEKRECFDLNAAKFKSGAMRFLGGKIAPTLEPFQNKDSTLFLL